jgi:hypothetical protein
MLKIDRTEIRDNVVRVTLSGVYGDGTEGFPSARFLSEKLRALLAQNTEIDSVEMDYSRVEYDWGDGPTTTLISLFRSTGGRITRATFISNQSNHVVLQRLCDLTHIDALKEIDIGPDSDGPTITLRY